jgi:hypothetical protein
MEKYTVTLTTGSAKLEARHYDLTGDWVSFFGQDGQERVAAFRKDEVRWIIQEGKVEIEPHRTTVSSPTRSRAIR